AERRERRLRGGSRRPSKLLDRLRELLHVLALVRADRLEQALQPGTQSGHRCRLHVEGSLDLLEREREAEDGGVAAPAGRQSTLDERRNRTGAVNAAGGEGTAHEELRAG